MTEPEPTIDLVLRRFFAAQRRGVAGRRRDRVDLVEVQLRAFLEEIGPSRVCDECRLILELEREFGTVDAVARYLQADALLVLLRPFVERPALPFDTEQRRVELRVIAALARYLDEHRLFDPHELRLRGSFFQLLRSVHHAEAAMRRTPG